MKYSILTIYCNAILPKEFIKAIVCATETTLNFVQPMVAASALEIKLLCKPEYYY